MRAWGGAGATEAVMGGAKVKPRWLETSKISPCPEASGHGWSSSHNRKVRRHSSPNIFAFSASHRIWVLTQPVMSSPPS